MGEKREFKIYEDDIINAKNLLFNEGKPCGLLTGFQDLDNLLGGIEPGELIVVGGRPSMGKTAFALSVIFNTSINGLEPALYLTPGMKKSRLIERLIRMIVWESAEINEDGYEDRVNASIDEIMKARLLIDDSPLMSIEYIDRLISECETVPRVVVVDYLQLINTTPISKGRRVGVSSPVYDLKEIGAKYGCAILALSQLSRRMEFRYNHRPLLADFKGDVDIEEVADKVMFLYRDEYYDKDSDLKGIAEVRVAKNYCGSIGTTELAFSSKSMRFFSLQRE